VTADPRDPSRLREQIAENQETIDRLNRDLARKSNEVRIIQQISSEITSTLDLDEVLAIVLRALDGVLGFAHSMILLKDLADDVLRVTATRGYAEKSSGAQVRMGGGRHRCRRGAPANDADRKHRRQHALPQDRADADGSLG
jgi:adenylate cyclase